MQVKNWGIHTASSKGTIQVRSLNFVQILMGAVKHKQMELWILCLWITPAITWEFYWREENKKED